MAIFVFALGLVLAICGLGGLLASVNLLPTEIGMLYAVCGVIALSASFVVTSIGALILRVAAAPARRGRSEPAFEPTFVAPPPFAAEPDAPPPEAAYEPEEETPLNENRAGHLPTLAEVEEAISHPESPPSLVGRYSAGGANYMIFSDGTIEAEMEDGAYRFASMGDFKAYIAGRKP
jgi:hypothetical protein